MKTPASIALALAAAALVWAGAAPADPARLDAHAREGAAGPLPAPPAASLYVMTDKPLYRPGETIAWRVWEVDRALAPRGAGHELTVKLLDPRGGVARDERVRAGGGGGHGEVALPADAVGGRYVLSIASPLGGETTRTLTVSTYELPRLKKSLAMTRASYRAGDRVSALVTVERATGEPAKGARVGAVAWIDGAEVHVPATTADRDGVAALRFTLPAAIARGDALLTVTVTDGGATESIQRRIPVTTDAVALAWFPEGGDLVAGLPARVYFAATTPLGAPAEVAGRIVDDQGREVARFASTFRGRGVVALTPEAGRSYRAVLDRDGAAAALPAARASGCALGARADGDEVHATVACSDDRAVRVVATLRGREVGAAAARAAAAPATVKVPLAGAGQGAVRVTLETAEGAPLAERLVYARLGRDLRVTITPDRDGYAPRDEVALTIETRTASGEPVAADLALAVVDDTVLNLADDRSGRIRARLYLEPELPGQTIDDPEVYFTGTPEAAAGLDLLLGTQGWRRFVPAPTRAR